MDKQSKYLLASIVESSQDSIVSIDLNRTVTSWNKGAERLYGYTAEEVIGKPLSLVMLPADIQGLIDKVDAIVQEITVPIYETVRIHKNGRHADLEILLSPVRNTSGKVIGISTVARDITLRKLHEQQKDEFISVASHELQTPITSIKAYSEILIHHLEQSSDELAASVVKKMDTQIDRLIDLIKTLLNTTRLKAGEMLLNIEQFDMISLIREQIEVFTLVSDQHRFILQASEARHVYGDRKLIGQVLTNLISNATKYSPAGGEIIVSVSEIENAVKVSVEDFGIGIPDEAQQKIFDRHFRVSSPTTAAKSGLGLGLYITSTIVAQNGGVIAVRSKEGHGSTFSFTLPNAR